MIRYLPVLIEVGLLVYCLIDIIGSSEGDVRGLPKIWWVILVIILPIIGGIAWLVAGRPVRSARGRAPWLAGPTAGFPEYERPDRPAPDDDPEFLQRMKRVDEEHKETLRRWEENLRRREGRLGADTENLAGEAPTDEDDPPRRGAGS